MNTKGQSGFSIVNIILGVILFIASIMLFAEPETFPAPLITLPLGLTFWIIGAVVMRKLRNYRQTGEEFNKKLLTINTVCFVLSCLILVACTVLPIIGPML